MRKLPTAVQLPAAAMTALIALAVPALAQPDTISFSADALESLADGGSRSGKLLVRGTASRFEYQHMGGSIVEIDLPSEGVRRVIFPQARTYLEFKGPPRIVNSPDAPCMSTPYQSCTKIGDEELGGVETEVWSLAMPSRNDDIRIWWDKSRRMAVREEYPGGFRMQAMKRQADDYEGFAAEQWEFSYFFPGGRYLGGMAVIATALQTPVIERRPDGTIRRLFNIAKRNVDRSAFDVPPGYRLIALPNPPPPGRTPPAGWRPMQWPDPAHAPVHSVPMAAPMIPPASHAMTSGDTARR